MFLIAADY